MRNLKDWFQRKKKEKEYGQRRTQVLEKMKMLLGAAESYPSMNYLVNAVILGSKVYLTTDPLILAQKEVIEKEFPIKICSELAEVNEYIEGVKTPFHYYKQ